MIVSESVSKLLLSAYSVSGTVYKSQKIVVLVYIHTHTHVYICMCTWYGMIIAILWHFILIFYTDFLLLISYISTDTMARETSLPQHLFLFFLWSDIYLDKRDNKLNPIALPEEPEVPEEKANYYTVKKLAFWGVIVVCEHPSLLLPVMFIWLATPITPSEWCS